MPSKNRKNFNAGKVHGTSRQKDLMKESEEYGEDYRRSHQGSDMIEPTIHEKANRSKNKNKSK
jgi:hypothetical protein